MSLTGQTVSEVLTAATDSVTIINEVNAWNLGC